MTKTDTPPARLFEKNRRKLVKLLPDASLAVFNSSDEYPRNGDQFYPFRQNSDLYYMTGTEQKETTLVLFPGCPDANLKEVLFIRRSSEKITTWEGNQLSVEDAKKRSGIGNVRYSDEMDMVLNEMMIYASYVYLNNYEYPKFQTDVESRDLRSGKRLRMKYPNHEYRRLAPLMHSLRMVKEGEEIEMMKQAIEITGKAFQRVLKNLKPGILEIEVQAEIDHDFTLNGAQGHAYKPIIASGLNACILHYTDNADICRDGELLLMDFGAEFSNYAADLTRTIPVSGKFTERQRACYVSVLKVQREAIKMMVPGNTIDNLNKEVNKLMEKEMIHLGLFTDQDVKEQDPDKPLHMNYFMHGTSHFLGLDVHDVGSKFEPFAPGMVFTVEPGLYIREEAIGIRLENNILIAESGPVDLTAQIPIEPDDVEAIMGWD